MVIFLNTRHVYNFKLSLCHCLKREEAEGIPFLVQDGGGRHLNAPPALRQGNGPQHPLNHVWMGHRACLEVM